MAGINLKAPVKIDLHLPQGWNACTADELETIAAVILTHTMAATSYRPFTMQSVKADLFFKLSGVDVITPPSDDMPFEEQYAICRKHVDGRWRRWWMKQTGKIVDFRLYSWQVVSWVNSELKWLDDEKAEPLTIFPYAEMTIHGREYHGPEAMMQDFSWLRYRYACDYMDYYVNVSNHMERLLAHPKAAGKKRLRDAVIETQEAMASFLSVIFNRKIEIKDEQTGLSTKDFAFDASQVERNKHDFISFDPIRWQVVQLWWSGMMRWCQKKFPHCFSTQKVKKGKQSSPLDLYTRMVATMEKYLGLDEATVNNQTFHLVLQHMEDMAEENERWKKIKAKKK